MPILTDPPVLSRPPAEAVRDVHRLDPDGTWGTDDGRPGLAFSFRDENGVPFTCSDNRWGVHDADAPEAYTVRRFHCSNGAVTAETAALIERLHAEQFEADRTLSPPRVGDRFRYRTDPHIIYEVLAVLDVKVEESGTTWMTVLRTGRGRDDWCYDLKSDQAFKGSRPTFVAEK